MGVGLKSRGHPQRTQCRRSLGSSRVPESELTSLGGENKKDRSQTRTEALCLQIRQFHTDSSCLHVYIQSHQSKGQRGGGDTSQTGRGSSENTIQQYAVGRQHLQKRNRRKKRLSSAKRKKNITKGFVSGRNALQQISTHVAGGL